MRRMTLACCATSWKSQQIRDLGADMMTDSEDSPDVGGKDDRLLSWDQVERIASISRSTAWRMERDGAFPRRVRVSPGRVGWWESELTLWKRSRSGRIPPPPPRKGARVPRLPGMARSMPRPAPEPTPAAPAAADPLPSKKARRRPTDPGIQIDFGF